MRATRSGRRDPAGQAAHIHLWRFLCERCAVKELADVHRAHLQDYIDERLKAGYAVSSINKELRSFHSLMVFLQSQGYAVPLALLRMHTLKGPDPLPKYLTDHQVRLLRDEMEQRIIPGKYDFVGGIPPTIVRTLPNPSPRKQLI